MQRTIEIDLDAFARLPFARLKIGQLFPVMYVCSTPFQSGKTSLADVAAMVLKGITGYLRKNSHADRGSLA